MLDRSPPPGAAVALAVILGCATATSASAQVRFADRTIDVGRYIRTGVNFSYRPLLDTPGLVYSRRTSSGIEQWVLDDSLLNGAEIPWEKARRLAPVFDPATRGSALPRFDSVQRIWTIVADSAQDERNDVYQLLDGGTRMRRITTSGLVQAQVPMGGRVALIERFGEKEPYGVCLSLVNVSSLRRVTLRCEADPSAIGSSPSWSPDGTALATWGVLYRIQGDSAVVERQLPPGNLVGWADEAHLRVLRSSPGIRNLFEVTRATGEARQISRFETGTMIENGVRLVDGRLLAFATIAGQFTAFDATTSQRLGSIRLPDGFTRGPGWGHHWLLTRNSTERPTEAGLLSLRVIGDSAVWQVRMLPTDSTAPQECNIEPVSYRSFDRTVSGFLYSPRQPLPQLRDRLAIVVAYYGGEAAYNRLASLWCEAGITTLSADIDRDTNADRGGNEIVDAIHGAKWLQGRLGLAERQVGAYGMSQGGYNAMRLMTFQPETNGHNVSYDFGFGIAQAGYSSMLTILQNTNTESPMIIATGNPDTEAGRAKLRERSPLDQVHRLNAALLLIHGTSDRRVEYVESEQIFNAGRALGKDVTLIPLPGEGHGVASGENLRTYFTAQLEFLERIRATWQRQVP